MELQDAMIFHARLNSNVRGLRSFFEIGSQISIAEACLQAYALDRDVLLSEPTLQNPQYYNSDALFLLIVDLLKLGDDFNDDRHGFTDRERQLKHHAIQLWVTTLAGCFDQGLYDDALFVWRKVEQARPSIPEALLSIRPLNEKAYRCALLTSDVEICEDAGSQTPSIYR